MWQLRELRAEGFRLFKDRTVYTPTHGVTFVAGVNTDTKGASSNMAGKSTLAMLLPFALYGCDLNGEAVATSCVSTGSDYAKVQARFVCGNDSVVVTRIRHEKNIPSGASRNTCKVRHIRAGKTQRFFGPAVDVQPYIDSLFGARELFLAAHCFGCATTQTPFADAGDKAQRRLFDLLINSSDLESAGAAVANKLTLTNAARTQLELNIHKAEGKDEATRTYLAELQEKLNALDVPVVSAVLNTSTAEAHTQLLRRAVSTARKQLRNATREQARNVNRSERAVLKCERAYSQVALQVQEVESRLQSLETLISTGACPLCGSRNGAAIAVEMRGLYDRRTQLLQQAKKAKTKISECAHTRHTLHAQDNANVAAATQKLHTVQERLLVAHTQLSEVRLRTQQHEQAAEQRQLLVNAIAQAEANLKTINLDALRKELSECLNTIHHLQFLATVFGPTGVKAYRFDLVTPLLNDIAARFSDILFGDGTRLMYSTQSLTKTQEVRERFECALYTQVRGKWRAVQTALSAGQRMRRDILHTFSMATLARQLGKASVSILVLDEVFRTLDATGIERVVSCLNDITSTEGVNNVLVIEHNDDLRSMFSTCVTVTRSGNRATIAHA